MGTNKISTAVEETFDKVKSIDELSEEAKRVEREITQLGEQIKEYATTCLKNLSSRRKETDIEMNTTRYYEKLIFANYGFGLMGKWGTNATSMGEVDYESFTTALFKLDETKDDKLGEYLKKSKIATLRKFLRRIHLLYRKKDEVEITLDEEKEIIAYLDDYTKNGKLTKRISQIILKDGVFKIEFKGIEDYYGSKYKSVNTRSPKLEDGIIIEQVFEEVKKALEERIKTLNVEKDNHELFISELKKDFANEFLLLELQKTSEVKNA